MGREGVENPETIPRDYPQGTTGLATVIESVLNCSVALARHLLARFIYADAPVFSFAEEHDFAKFCRELKKPSDDPERQLLAREIITRERVRFATYSLQSSTTHGT